MLVTMLGDADEGRKHQHSHIGRGRVSLRAYRYCAAKAPPFKVNLDSIRVNIKPREKEEARET
jgi:hypothetical protein